MAQKNRTTLKSYFQQGDIPTENEYIDLIDSFPSFNDPNSGSLGITGSITLSGSNGNLTASNILLDYSGSGVTGGLLDGVYRLNAQEIGSPAGTQGDITFVNDVDFNNQTLNNLTIGGGNINNTTIGLTTPTSGKFTTLTTTGDSAIGNSNDDKHFFIGGVTGSSFLIQDVNGSGTLRAHDVIIGDVGQGSGAPNSQALTISTSGSLFASGSITASGDISSSGTVTTEHIYIPTGGVIEFPATSFPQYIVSEGDEILKISGSSNFKFDTKDGHLAIKAEPHISNAGGLTVGGLISGSSGIDLNGDITTTGNITASGAISASGNILANNATIAEQIDMTSANNAVLNMYQDTSLNISLNSRGNINSFINNGGNNLGIGVATPTEVLQVEGNISGSGNLKVDGSQVDFTNLPTSDPSVAGRLYRDGTDLKISLG